MTWCDKQLMKEWIRDEWGNNFTNPPANGSIAKILVADVHKAQQTDPAKRLLQSKKTILANLSPGCMSRVQHLNVVTNEPLKSTMKEQCERHLDKNLSDYVDGKGLGKDLIIRSFKKCGITTNVDGSEIIQVNIWWLEDYVMPASSSKKRKDDWEWVTDNNGNANNNRAPDFWQISNSDDENKD